MKPPRYPLVEVRWLDSVQLDRGRWLRIDSLPGELTAEALGHRTVGYLVGESEVALALARSLSDYHDGEQDLDEQAEGVLVIPVGSVLEKVTRAPGRGTVPA